MGDQGLRIYIWEEDVLGYVTKLGAHVSTVKYTYKGNDYEVLMENEDFTVLDRDNE